MDIQYFKMSYNNKVDPMQALEDHVGETDGVKVNQCVGCFVLFLLFGVFRDGLGKNCWLFRANYIFFKILLL